MHGPARDAVRDQVAPPASPASRSPTRTRRVLILSDLHVEIAPFEPAPVQADVVVLAGDIHNGTQAVHWARAAFPHHPIVQIAGNHESWDACLERCIDALREAALRCDVDFLEHDAVVQEGIEFLGCTLWSDYRVFEVPGRPHRMSAEQAMAHNRARVLDFAHVRTAGGERLLEPEDCVAMNSRSRAWLTGALGAPRIAPRVVVTHFLPSWRSVSSAFAGSVTNAAYVNDADALVAQADLWVHGHTHSSHAYAIGRCEVRCNPRGYPRPRRVRTGFENPAFDPGFTVEIDCEPGP